MRVFELFAGIGAPRVALKRAGILHQSVGFSEIDKYAIKSYCAVHGESELMNYGDITKIKELPPTDLLFHGSPCQDFSVAGKGRGGNEGSGTRSSLMWETVRLIEGTKPKCVIWENVKGALAQKNRHNFDKYLDTMSDMGYNNYWKILNSKDYGVPQNRERVFVVSILKSVDQGIFNWPKPFDNGLRLKHMLETNVDEKYYISDEKCAKLLSQFKSIPTEGMISIGNTNPSGNGMNGNVYAGDISPTLTTNKGEGMKIVVPCLTPDRIEKRQNGRRFKTDGEPMFCLTGQDRHGVITIDIKSVGHPTRGGALKNDIVATLDHNCYQAVIEPNELNCLGLLDIKGNEQIRRVYDDDGIAPTLSTMQGGNREPKVYTRFRIRKLTPKECWRLQGFSDSDFDKAQSVCSNTQLYKQAGNSITVDVLVYIFKQLFEPQERQYEIGEQLSII